VAVAAIETRPAHDPHLTKPVYLDRARRLKPTQPASGAVLVDAAASIRSPDCTKNVKVRLAHVLCEGEVAVGVRISRGTKSREQMDAKKSRGEVWVLVVGDLFNSDKTFCVPAACSDLDIDRNAHTRFPASRGGMAFYAASDTTAAMAIDREVEGAGALLGPEEDID